LEKFVKYDTVIFDTAGRNALDAHLADELKKLKELIKPDEVLLVIPADLGKVARIQAEEFHKLAGVTGVIITKMDGTAKAGGALAATSVTNAKVKFIGVGEHIDDFEDYEPKRFVSRLLGMGDLQSLLEKAKEADFKPETAEKIIEGKKIRKFKKSKKKPSEAKAATGKEEKKAEAPTAAVAAAPTVPAIKETKAEKAPEKAKTPETPQKAEASKEKEQKPKVPEKKPEVK
jgi:signal recognition particle GTPase